MFVIVCLCVELVDPQATSPGCTLPLAFWQLTPVELHKQKKMNERVSKSQLSATGGLKVWAHVNKKNANIQKIVGSVRNLPRESCAALILPFLTISEAVFVDTSSMR